MQLLAEIGDAEVVAGPAVESPSRTYTPDEIEEIVIHGTVGELLARARSQAGQSMASIGEVAGVTRARIQQLEHSDNIEIATLVRVAAACGYQVNLSLRPTSDDRRPLSALLGATAEA